MKYTSTIKKMLSLLVFTQLLFGALRVNAQLTSYVFSATTGTFTAITGGTTPTLSGGNSDDGYYNNIPLGFSFTYNGIAYTTVAASTNGWLSFVGNTTLNTLTNNLNSGAPRPLLAPLWDDNEIQAGNFSYKTDFISGDSVFTAQWLNTEWNYNSSPTLSFQVKLFKNSGTIQFIYRQESGSPTPGNPGASIGITAVGTGSGNFLSLSNSTASPTISSTTENNNIILRPATGQIYQFSPPVPCAGAPIAGTVNPASQVVCGSATFSLSGYSLTTGISFKWQDSVSGGGWADVTSGVGDTTPTYATTISADRYFRCRVTCNNSSQFEYSSIGAALVSTPVGGTATPTLGSVCNSSTTVVLSGATSGLGITYQWQDSTSGGAWADVTTGSGGTTTTYTTPVLTAQRFFRCRVSCTSSALFSYSNVAAVNSGCVNYDVTRNTSVTYTNIQSTGTNFSWVSPFSGDDVRSNTVTLTPATFNFTYAGQVVTGFQVCTNGWMTFNTSNTSTAYTNGFGTGFPLTLAPFWDDLVAQGNSTASLNNIKYQITGTLGSRILTVEWFGMETYNNAGPDLNFQVKLYEGSNNVEFVYGKMQGFDGTNNFSYSHTIGLSGSSLSGTILSGQLLAMRTNNTRQFDSVSTNTHTVIPACNSSYLFTPGAYTPYTPPGSVIPANDSIGAPTVLTVNPTPCTDLCGTYYSSANATPSTLAVCNGTADDDVWFRFAAPASGEVVITVRGGGGFDPVFSVMTEATLDTTGMGAAGCRNATGTGLIETASITGLTPSTNYLIRVYHQGTGSGADGMFSICVNTITPPPANDNIGGAAALTVGTTTCTGTNGSTVTATASPQPLCTGTPDDDIWYSFTPTIARNTIRVQSNSGFNAAFEVVNSANMSIGCVNNTSTGQMESITFDTLTPSSTYYIRVYHAATGAGTGSFSICVFGVAVPTVQATAVTFNNTTNNSTTVSWTNGNGAKRLVVAKANASTLFTPVNFNGYTANSVFGSGNEISIGSQNYVVYNDTGSSVTVTGLAILSGYDFYVYEYNGSGSAETYLTPGATSNITTLPVKLLSFDIGKNNADVLLNWATASEENNAGFDIQRSVDGKEFVSVAFVKGNGTSNQLHHYQFTDVAALNLASTVYYRLKQMDFNGAYEFSPVISISEQKVSLSGLKVLPNPFSQDVSVQFNTIHQGAATLVVTDITGKVVYSNMIETQTGANTIKSSELGGLGKGIYFLSIINPSDRVITKLIKE